MEIEQSGPIIAHCWRNHGMRPIISRYFVPTKKIKIIKIRFDTLSQPLWASKNPRWPTKMGYRTHLISFTRCLQNHGIWYISIRLFLSLRTDIFIFLDISTICGYPGPSRNPRWPLKIWNLNKVSQLLLIVDENLACDISSSGWFHLCNETMAISNILTPRETSWNPRWPIKTWKSKIPAKSNGMWHIIAFFSTKTVNILLYRYCTKT